MATNAVGSTPRTTASSSVSSGSFGKGTDKGSSSSKSAPTFPVTPPLASSKLDKPLGAIGDDLSCSIKSDASGKSTVIKDSGSPLTLGDNESLSQADIKVVGKGNDAIHVTGDNVCVTDVNVISLYTSQSSPNSVAI